MAAGAAALWALNGGVAKVILDAGISPLRLAQVRSTGACVGLLLVVAATARARLHVRRREVPFLIAFGVAGLAFVQWFYFLAIHRLALGIALLLQYTAPLLVALWARFVLHEPVRRRIWLALACALVGLALIVDIGGGSVSATGVLFAAGAALAFALYVLTAERGVGQRDALSLLAWGFLFASLFWSAIAPWWSFPASGVGDSVSLLGRLADTHLPLWVLLSGSSSPERSCPSCCS